MPRNWESISEIQYIAKHLNITTWELAPDYRAYAKRFANANTHKNHLLHIMETLQHDISESLIIFWWSTTRKFLMWYDEIRDPSYDIDTYIPLQEIGALEQIAKYSYDKKVNLTYAPHQDNYFYMELLWNPISISVWDIYSHIPTIEHTTMINNLITVLCPEYLVSLKLLKKNRKGNYRNKDIIDISNLLLSWKYGKIPFDFHVQSTIAKTIWSLSITHNNFLNIIENINILDPYKTEIKEILLENKWEDNF